jgi:hypothetical protein
MGRRHREPQVGSEARLTLLVAVFFGALTVLAAVAGPGASPLVLALAFFCAVLATYSVLRFIDNTRITVGSIVIAAAAFAAFLAVGELSGSDQSVGSEATKNPAPTATTSPPYNGIPSFQGEIKPFESQDFVAFLDQNKGNDIYLDITFTAGRYLDVSRLSPVKPSDSAIFSFWEGCDPPSNDEDPTGRCTDVDIRVEPNPKVAQHVYRITEATRQLKGYFSVADYNSHMSGVVVDLRPISAKDAAPSGGGQP